MTYHESVKIGGHHVYALECIAPFLYRIRIGTGRWRYTLNGAWAKEMCEHAAERVRQAHLRES